MLIVFDSKTGNVQRFVTALDMNVVKITSELLMNEPFVLVTYTTGFGKVPQTVEEFLKKNHSFLCGVSASGNRNWGDNFANSANTISEQYNVPIISKFEMSGFPEDVEYFKERVYQIGSEAYRIK